MFSFIPRRFLARQGGFKGHRGVESVNLYYVYALEKYMERNVLSQKQISLSSFAIHSISSDSPNLQLHGVWMMYNLLHKEPSRTQLLSKLHDSSSRDAVARLVNMLQWKNPEDTTIRLFAAKAIAMLAGSIRVITIPGSLQAFSALLDVGSEPKRGKSLMFTVRDDEQAGTKQDIVTVDAIQQEGHRLVLDTVDHNLVVVHLQHSIQMQQAGGNHDQHNSSCVRRVWRWVLAFWSVPQEDPLTDHDILPALGMSILDSLVSDSNYDLQNNCLKISKGAQYLIPKIVRFTCCSKGMQKLNFNEVQRRLLMESSLKLLERFSSIDGAIDITLRHRLTEHPTLLSNLASILDDRCFTSQEARKLAMAILRNLAIDSNTCQEIGRIKLIISRMMEEFLSQAAHSSTNPDQHLQKVAGQALALLTMQSADSCASILMEPGNFIEELTSMVRENRHIYVASALLQNLLLYIKPPNNLTNSNLRELLCSTLPKVLGTIIMETEGEELEVLIGLSSQICKVIPEDFAQELENSQRKERFLKRLVNTLEANTNPAVHCLRIRRVIIEQAIHLMQYSCQYAVFFNQHSMMEALLMVEEQTPSTIERYRVFLGNEGFMEYKEPLTDLVATAKGLMCCQWLGGIN